MVLKVEKRRPHLDVGLRFSSASYRKYSPFVNAKP